MYGHRARIGYTSPLATTEVFPYEFYEVVPKGVTLVLSTLTVMSASSEEIESSYRMSLDAAAKMARVGVDLVVLGGIPINISRGVDRVDELIRETEAAIAVPVTTSVTAQMEALRAIGAKNVAVGHPRSDADGGKYADILRHYGLGMAGVIGAQKTAKDLGRIPLSTSVDLARALKRAYPAADAIWLPCPHWAIGEAVEEIESDLGVTVVTANQAITWQALRRCGVTDRVAGYGTLLARY
jgi:maleate cis-trans isomerase